MGAQGDVDLVVHIKPFGMVVQLLSLQGHSCHEPKSPVEVFKMELFEDGITALQFVPPHSPQVWQQLVPFLCTQSVCFASLLCKMPSRQLSPALTKPGMTRGRGSVLCSRKAGVQELKGVQNHAVAETDRRQDRQPHTHMWRELERDRFRFYKAVHRTDDMNLLAGTSSSPHPTIYQPHCNMAVTSLAL